MNDIVNRLRLHAKFVLPNHTDETPTETVLLQAADEIEMLRRLLQEQIAATRHMINAHEARETELLLQLEEA